MIRRPPRSTLFPYTPLSRFGVRREIRAGDEPRGTARSPRRTDLVHGDGERVRTRGRRAGHGQLGLPPRLRSEEHTSELQSQSNLVCRLLLEKKKKKKYTYTY